MKTLLIIVVLAVSCSHLSQKGRLVQVWEEVKPEQNGNYREAGEVSCLSTYIFFRSLNRKRCVEQLQNAASRLKADVVVVDKESDVSSFLTPGVSLTGTAYKYVK